MRKLLAAAVAIAATIVAVAGLVLLPGPSKKEKPAAPDYGEVIGTAQGCPVQIPGVDLSTFTATAYANDEARITVVCEPPLETGPPQ